MARVHSAPTRDLDVVTLHDILRLRQDVFVVEQQCVYADVDGRDLEPTTVQVWATDDIEPGDEAGVADPAHAADPADPAGTVVATLRLLAEPDGSVRIGRVATGVPARGRGLAADLMTAALALGTGPVVLDAQSHLERWYARFGFVRVGEEFLDDGIPHVPMRLDR
ncbi:MAG TPA: GNAT family N-acetyltransferase [Ornithinibacter sp.]|nr:GNAT family N-acetyltransferase [Ornithinibacter sp.]